MKGNKKQLDEFSPVIISNRKIFSKKLSKIQQDAQIDSPQKILPTTHKTNLHNSEVILGNKLKRIISLKPKRKGSHSLQSRNSFLSHYKHQNELLKSQNLPQIKPIIYHNRNKSSLDKILSDQGMFAKAYFEQISRAERFRKNHVEEQTGIQFQFPEIKVGNWRVIGYLKQNHVLLKGIHKDCHTCIKKYDYTRVYQKMKNDYQAWVQSKYQFQN